ncbi:MAG: hypothetical protein QXN66_00820 [Thermoplasmatales archaeon]
MPKTSKATSNNPNNSRETVVSNTQDDCDTWDLSKLPPPKSDWEREIDPLIAEIERECRRNKQPVKVDFKPACRLYVRLFCYKKSREARILNEYTKTWTEVKGCSL